MGKILYDAPTPHEHDYPSQETTSSGTIWQCECGRVYMLGWRYLDGIGARHKWWQLTGRTLKKVLKEHNININGSLAEMD